MSTLRNQTVKLGIFVALVAAILLASLLAIGGLRFWRPVDAYRIVTAEGVSGLAVNSTVMLRGVEVGEVAAIELDPRNYSQVLITIEIDPRVIVPVGTRAYFERVGLTGQRAINLGGGTLAAGRLAPGSLIPRGETELERLAAQAKQLGESLTGLTGELDETAARIEALVAAIDPERVAAIVAAVEPERVAAILEQTDAASERFAKTGRELERAVGEARGHVAGLRGELEQTNAALREDLDEVTGKAAAALERADAAAEALLEVVEDADVILESNKHDLRKTVLILRKTAQEARELIEAVREQPSLLLRSRRRDRRR